LETVLVGSFVRKNKPESQLLSDEIKRAEPSAELLEKALQDKKERLGGFDFVLELELLGESFRRPNESQKPGRFAARFFPEPDGFRPEEGGQLVLGESGELAERVDAPFVENGEEAGNFRGARFCWWHGGD
jgi:hypothetical protein